MINIFTSVVNRPEFVEIQKKTFDKFLKEKYQFHVVDDSLDESISAEFRRVCEANEINYYRKPQGDRSLNEEVVGTVLVMRVKRFNGLMIH